MAMAWIREIRNHRPNSTLRVRVFDNGRHPSLGGKTYGNDEWMIIPAGSENQPTIVCPENMGVPWSYGGAQRMIIETEIDGVTKSISAEVRGDSGWDYLVLRDGQLNQFAATEIGSLGYAPGINHSWWGVVLHSDGKLEWHLFERQGLRRDDLVDIVKQTGGFIIDLVPQVMEAVARGAVEALAAA